MKNWEKSLLKATLPFIMTALLLTSCKDDIAVTGISLDKNVHTMKAGETVLLDPTITPLDATNDFVIWESSDATLASVDDDGLVTAIREGEVDIIAISDDGGFADTCKITVNPATGSTINISGDITENATWVADYTYLLSGFVYVVDGVTLTIEPGTIIKGDKITKATLVVERGAKIIAEGTASKPIIFTSNQNAGSRNYGDWGG